MTHNLFPFSLPILKTTDVFRRILFFPSGRRVERQVRQGSRSGGAVKQSTWGKEEDVPVPSQMTSTDPFVELK